MLQKQMFRNEKFHMSAVAILIQVEKGLLPCLYQKRALSVACFRKF